MTSIVLRRTIAYKVANCGSSFKGDGLLWWDEANRGKGTIFRILYDMPCSAGRAE